MKKFISALLCALLLISFCACAKKTDFSKMLPDTIWDNYTTGISLVFEKDGVCTVSNPNSLEKCVYTVDGETLTITGAVSTWTGKISEGEIFIDKMRGDFLKSSERSFYPPTESYGFVISPEYVEEPADDIIYDLTFWYGVYTCGDSMVSIGSADIPNTLTYVVVLANGEQTNGTIKPNSSDRFILENNDLSIVKTESGIVVNGADGTYDAYDGTYTKVVNK